jgi:hypothetical protein
VQEKITAALQKTGHPIAPGELAKLVDMEGSALGYHLKNMLDAGTLKASGAARSRRIGLPAHDFAAPASESFPRQRQPKKHRKAKRASKRAAAPRARAAEAHAAPAAKRFIPAVDADRRLVIVNGGEPLIFDDEQTAAIATLLFTHYDKE